MLTGAAKCESWLLSMQKAHIMHRTITGHLTKMVGAYLKGLFPAA